MDDRRVEYSRKLLAGEQISYKFITYSSSIRELTLGLISQYLGEKHLNYLRSAVFTFLTEVINNAVKANLKRIYSAKTGDDPGLNFNEEAVANIESYAPDLKTENLLVQIIMQQKPEGLYVAITNNTGIAENELVRINERLAHATSFDSMETAMDHFIDTSEGGGLGLILTVTLLKNSGIDPSLFKIESNEKITRVSLTIPTSIGIPERTKEIEKRILQAVEYIPALPETVRNVLDLCNNPESSMSQVAMEIEKDPALTADVLKLVNSAAFNSSNRVKNLSSALPILGMKNIKEVTLASASLTILNRHFRIFKTFWEHSFKCGFYAKKIAELLDLNVEKETVYLGGLLHDMGKIILQSVDPKGVKQIEDLKIDKNRTTSSTLEEVNLGLSHEQIGAIVAENWGFSQDLIEMIRNHHRPFMSDRSIKLETSIVHLANALLNTEESTSSYIYIDSEAFKRLSLGSMEELSRLHEELKKSYNLSAPTLPM